MTYNPLSLFPLPAQVTDPKPVPSALAVDGYADMLWVGSAGGIVSAFASPLTLTRNVQFPAHGTFKSLDFVALPGIHGVRQIRVTDREVWTLADGGIGGRKRGGAPRWSVTDATCSLRAMTPAPTNSHEVLAGGTGQMLLINNARGDVVRRYDTARNVVHLGTLARTIVCASGSGQVSLLDPRTGFRPAANVVPVQAHTGGMSGADTQGHLIATWGWTHMQGHPLPDSLVQLYDTRTLRALPPISFSAGPAFVHLHPSDPSKIVIASQSGMLQIADMNAGTNEFQQLDVNSYITSMALSQRGDYLVFGDGDGQVHLWTLHDTGDGATLDANGNLDLPPFNGYEGIKPEWPDPVETPSLMMLEDPLPLNAIGVPHYEDPLLSNCSPANYATVYSPFFNPPEPIPQSILATLQYQDFVGYGQLPKEFKERRNVVTARAGAGKQCLPRGAIGNRRESEPRFRSEKDRVRRKPSAQEIDEITPAGQVPKYYRKVTIKYSRFGIEDFDFGFYNRTVYSGLETDISNSYTNALLQAMHYTLPIRTVAKAHICVDCQKEACLLCEAGFLFRMLEDAKGTNCQASNFSRAFGATPQATALGLMDSNDKLAQHTLIQNCNRWLLSTFTTESVVNGKSFNLRTSEIGNLSLIPGPSAINQVLAIAVKTTNTCLSCNYVSTRESDLQTVDLAYPRKAADAGSFAEVLCAAIVRSSSTKAACPSCKQFAPLDSRRSLTGNPERSLPPVLSVNAMVGSPEQQDIWRDRTEGGKPKRFLPLSVAFQQGPKGLMAENNGDTGIVYDIKSVVAQVQTAPENPAHLLSFARVSDDQWVMFNDFLVRPVKEEEVFSFADWKVPAIIILERRDSSSLLDFSRLPKELDHGVLFKDQNLAHHRDAASIKAEMLTPVELPKPGTLISIDAEFVALQQEELEFRSDGTKKILRPSHMSLARVSVLRGSGEKEGVPFIDDYIYTKETIADYLTEFSGIKAGDLDPNTSKQTLVALKVAYKKLRLLVDLGCIFIGHGLSKDFRTINIYVPPEQVLDTVNLYTVPGRSRKLSLRFLAWFLLKKEIQSKEHDSIEDARYAYLLYKKYQQFEEDGRFEDVMEDIFAEGHKTGFKPKSEAEAARADVPTTETPSAASPAPILVQPGNGAFPPLQNVRGTKYGRVQWAPAAPFVPGQRRW
ncbi:hypothetical protein CspeluHIS016_0405530 [Cutaneotrichosporon spelunceum]|uniref:PAN2-PAN3 deadenylation complex catalytic subunit PAN2 n=1 Tax=Cutaneotrichosporon spelunceum TaxID=1672016 RepID=A0AAD3TVL1_9TREE|nr:hypothetical protein CspeluHIS016_0405530 [Cutaneotrichosporon spelunceum]